MSREARDWAWSVPLERDGRAERHTRRLVLLYLAERANSAGECYPGVEKITACTDLDRSTVLRALAGLAAEGLLCSERRHDGSGRRKSNLYRLSLSRATPPSLGGATPSLSRATLHLSRATPPEPEREPEHNRQRESAPARATPVGVLSLDEFLEDEKIRTLAQAKALTPDALAGALIKFRQHNHGERYTRPTWLKKAQAWVEQERTTAPPPAQRHDHAANVAMMDAFASQALVAERVVFPGFADKPAWLKLGAEYGVVPELGELGSEFHKRVRAAVGQAPPAGGNGELQRVADRNPRGMTNALMFFARAAAAADDDDEPS